MDVSLINSRLKKNKKKGEGRGRGAYYSNLFCQKKEGEDCYLCLILLFSQEPCCCCVLLFQVPGKIYLLVGERERGKRDLFRHLFVSCWNLLLWSVHAPVNGQITWALFLYFSFIVWHYLVPCDMMISEARQSSNCAWWSRGAVAIGEELRGQLVKQLELVLAAIALGLIGVSGWTLNIGEAHTRLHTPSHVHSLTRRPIWGNFYSFSIVAVNGNDHRHHVG